MIDKTYIFLIIISIVATFTYDQGMTDAYILPKWLYTIEVASMAGIFYSLIITIKEQRHVNERFLFLILICLCLSQSIYTILQSVGWLPTFIFNQVAGSFDNPAGLVACISVGIPYCLYFIHTAQKKAHKILFVTVIIVIALALIFSESRSGIFAGIIFPVSLFIFRKKKKLWIQMLFLSLCMILISAMYVIKRDSADGRMLILYSGWEMLKDSPIYGHGFGSIHSCYMNYQAEWLAKHPDSALAFLADNVKHVFNEYLLIGIYFGIIGLIILSLFVAFMIHCYYKRPTIEGKYALMSQATIAVLGCFSYPLYYPFTWIVLILNTYVLVHQSYKLEILKRKAIKYPFIFILLLVSSFMLYHTTRRIYAEWEWGKLVSVTNKDKVAFAKYESLMPILGKEPYFLYNYSAESYINGNYGRAYDLALKCKKYWADYDLELLLGELQEKMHRNDEAMVHYSMAHNMCPVRFIPLYKQFKIYKELGDTVNMKKTGNKILSKQVKIPSRKIDIIINNVKYELQNMNSDTIINNH